MQMKYIPLTNLNDSDIPLILSVYRLPEVSRYISIDVNNYWSYVTSSKNIYFYKIYHHQNLVGTLHCEVVERTLYMSIVIFPEYQNRGIATAVIDDVKNRKFSFDFQKIEISIDETNIASIKLFEKMGFRFSSKEDELLNYIYPTKKLG